MAPLRVSILGTGLSLQAFHYPLILALPDQFVLHSVLERSGRGKAKEVCGTDTKVVASLDEVLQDAEVDVVVVSTPNKTHYPFVKAALEAGKHVMVEKPVTPTLAEAEELYALAEKKGLVLCVYQNRRWDVDFLTLQKLIASGKIGEVHELSSHFDRFRPLPASHVASGWKETPGEHNEAIYNLGSHVLDQAVVLFGVPAAIACRSWDQRGTGLAEAFSASLYYPAPREDDGRTGSRPPSAVEGTVRSAIGKAGLEVKVQATMLSSLPEQVRFVVKGTRGSWVKHGLDLQEPFLRAGKKVTDDGYGIEAEDAWGTLATVDEGGKWTTEKLESEKGWYPSIYANLHDAITHRDAGRLAVQPAQVLAVLRLIELGLQSSREGRVVQV
ncbi:hypothetical protein Q5752_002411 [Cryptotrichosporon argae]